MRLGPGSGPQLPVLAGKRLGQGPGPTKPGSIRLSRRIEGPTHERHPPPPLGGGADPTPRQTHRGRPRRGSRRNRPRRQEDRVVAGEVTSSIAAGVSCADSRRSSGFDPDLARLASGESRLRGSAHAWCVEERSGVMRRPNDLHAAPFRLPDGLRHRRNGDLIPDQCTRASSLARVEKNGGGTNQHRWGIRFEPRVDLGE